MPQSTAINYDAAEGGELAGSKRACVNGCTSSFGACHEPSPCALCACSSCVAQRLPSRLPCRLSSPPIRQAQPQQAQPKPPAAARRKPGPSRRRTPRSPGPAAGPAAQGSRGRHGQRPADPAVGARGRPAVAAATISQHAPAGGVPRAARPHHRQQAGRPGGQEEQGHRGSGLQEAHGLRRGPGAAGFLDPARDRPPGHAPRSCRSATRSG